MATSGVLSRRNPHQGNLGCQGGVIGVWLATRPGLVVGLGW
jgi:hypothetical protein